MATKTIDVTLANIRNVGSTTVSPIGFIAARVVRSINDEQVFKGATLFSRPQRNIPLVPDGARSIAPGDSLTFNTTEQLVLSQFEVEAEGQFNQMLIFHSDLTESVPAGVGSFDEEHYSGSFNHKVRFDDIVDSQTIECDYSVNVDDAKIVAVYIVSLVSSSH